MIFIFFLINLVVFLMLKNWCLGCFDEIIKLIIFLFCNVLVIVVSNVFVLVGRYFLINLGFLLVKCLINFGFWWV